MKKYYKEFLIVISCILVIILIMVEWKSFSWIFNYAALSRAVSHLTESSGGNSPNSIQTPPMLNDKPKPDKYPLTERPNSIEIPKLGIIAPLVFSASRDINKIARDLDEGVVHYPESVFPGQSGQTTLLGHSAPENWPHIKYDWVFSEIDDLENEDRVIIYFDGRKYTYTVIGKGIVRQGTEITTSGFRSTDNILTLISCWPPGKNYYRIIVRSKLQ